MKILHVIATMSPQRGGVSQAVRNIILDNHFCNHEVVCMDEIAIDYGVVDKFLIHKVGPGKTAYQYNPDLKKWLSANIINYSHVVVHGIWQYHNFATYQVIKNLVTRPKLLIMPHGMLDPYFQKAAGRKFKAFRNRIIWFVTEKSALNSADAVLYTCDEELLLARDTFPGYRPKQEFNVGLGVLAPPDENEIMHIDFRKKAAFSGRYWLYLSRLHPKKGVKQLIEAYIDLECLDPNLPFLVIAGPLDDDYAKMMKSLASKNSKIIFVGMITGNAKWGAFYGCDAFILPSFQENFGIAIVEAMACKKPVVITRHINIWREIIDGDGGIVLDNINVESIKKVFCHLESLPKKILHVKGEKAFDTYKTYFDLKECAKRFVTQLETLV